VAVVDHAEQAFSPIGRPARHAGDSSQYGDADAHRQQEGTGPAEARARVTQKFVEPRHDHVQQAWNVRNRRYLLGTCPRQQKAPHERGQRTVRRLTPEAIFAARMKMLLLRAFVLARRRHHLAEATRRQYRQRLERELDAVMALAPTSRDGRRLRKRYGKVRAHLFTFLDHPELAPDNNSSERELRPTATYRKVTGGFRSNWGPDLFAGFRSVVGTAARRGIGAYQAIKMTLQGKSVLAPG
jgi:hypothetical protein